MKPPARESRWRRWWTPWRSRLQRWALRRQGVDELPVTLRARRLYILPTRAGLAFAAVLATMFIAGMNYGSGLAMLLCFWLTGFLVTAMLRTHRLLAGTRMLGAAASPGFAGQSVALTLRLAPRIPGARLTLRTGRTAAQTSTQASDEPVTLQLAVPVERRGVWQAPPLELETRAPFGLFRCWTWLQLPVSTEVYPAPAGSHLPPEAPGEQPRGSLGATGGDELTWLRPFREGDSPRQVAWKAYARGMPLLVREYRGSGRAFNEFDFAALHGLETEQRLSQLARWIVDASSRGEAWALRLPGQPELQGFDADHRARCLGALARF